MRSRHLLLLLALAGCATPAVRSSAPTPAAPTPPPPVTSQAPGPVAPITASGDMTFDAWSAGFYGRALAAGISPDLVRREFAGLTPDPRVARLDARQPEFSKPLSAYIAGTVTDGRVAIGQAKAQGIAQFPQIEQRFGVPREILLGVWAMESGFGAIQGDFDVIRVMATLAAQGRRRDFAEDQLIAAL
jgi:membrane-bound lytic murein transglycosylase B